MAELARLRVAGRDVATCLDGASLDATLAPRPYLHPVQTLAGRVVTGAQPADHRWHLGVSVAIQDVDGHNLWGGRTYLRDRGYTWRTDHGRIVHAGFDELAEDDFVQRLRWLTGTGEELLTERRTVRASPAPDGWELELLTELANPTDRELRLGSPATNGRTGAGYGGLFWRLPPATAPTVQALGGASAPSGPSGAGGVVAEGEAAVHGLVAPVLVWTERGPDPFTLVLVATDAAADPWFVRVDGYPGVGSQLAAVHPVAVPPGAAVSRGVRVLVADGALDRAAIAAWSHRRGPADGRVAYPPP